MDYARCPYVERSIINTNAIDKYTTRPHLPTSRNQGIFQSRTLGRTPPGGMSRNRGISRWPADEASAPWARSVPRSKSKSGSLSVSSIQAGPVWRQRRNAGRTGRIGQRGPEIDFDPEEEDESRKPTSRCRGPRYACPRIVAFPGKDHRNDRIRESSSGNRNLRTSVLDGHATHRRAGSSRRGLRSTSADQWRRLRCGLRCGLRERNGRIRIPVVSRPLRSRCGDRGEMPRTGSTGSCSSC